MPVGRGEGEEKNRETVTASLSLVFAALVAPATATPDWGKGLVNKYRGGRWGVVGRCI